MTRINMEKFTPVLTQDLEEGLTEYVADFILATQFEDIPRNVLDRGRKSMLDGFGLALSVSVAQTGKISRQHILDVAAPGPVQSLEQK